MHLKQSDMNDKIHTKMKNSFSLSFSFLLSVVLCDSVFQIDPSVDSIVLCSKFSH